MAEPGVELIGLDEASRDMRQWADDLAPAVANQARQLADTVRAQVAAKVPVLTGTLASSVEVIDEPEGVTVGIGDGVPYAGWIEFGGSRGRPHIPEGRYLYPTALAATDEFGQVATKAAYDTVERFPWSKPTSS